MITSQRNSWNNNGLWILISPLIIIMFIYLLFSTHFGGHVKINNPHNGIETYDALAEAILHGHININYNPSDYRLKPIAKDLSFYDNKYYLYWGIAPAILFYVPFRAIFATPLPDVVIVYLLMVGAFFFAIAIIFHVRNRFYPTVSNIYLACAFMIIGMGNIASYMLQQARVYEATAASGHFFFMGGLYGITRWLLDKKLNAGYLIISSLFFGITILSQPIYCPAMACILMLLIYVILKKEDSKNMFYQITAIVIPFIMCFILSSLYNYIRFNDAFEFGLRFQNNGLQFKKITFDAMPRGFYLQVLQPPVILQHFPYLSSRGNDSISSFLSFKFEDYNYRMISLFYITPILWIFFIPLNKAVSYILKTRHQRFHLASILNRLNVHVLNESRLIKTIILIAFIVNFLFILAYPYNDFRYQIVYIVPALILATFIWFEHLTIYFSQYNYTQRLLLNPYILMPIFTVVSLFTNFMVSFL